MMKGLKKLFKISNLFSLKRDTNNLKVLAFHTIDNPVHFEKLMIWLRSNFNIINLDQLNDYVFKNNRIPKNSVLITFDDGDISVYNNGVSILKKLNIPAVLFVITNLINTKNPFWWDEIEYYLGKEEGNKKVWETKNWPNKHREVYLEDLRHKSQKAKLTYPQLTIEQLKEMQEAGIIIANHSHTHPMFNQCTTKELEMEMKNSTTILKDLGFSPELFAYPNGNYSSQSEKVIKEFGIKHAYLFDHKINKDNVNPLRISRLIVNDTTPLWKFKFILSGWHGKILPLTKAIGKLKK